MTIGMADRPYSNTSLDLPVVKCQCNMVTYRIRSK